MTIQYDEAIDEMFKQFRVPWELNAGAIAGYVPEVRWPGVSEPDKPPKDKFWCRVSQQTVLEQQDSLSNCVGLPYQKRYENTGLLFVQLFCPKSKADAFEKGRKLAKLARNAYRGKTTEGGIVFRNVTISELPPEELFYRFNVQSEYEFGELG